MMNRASISTPPSRPRPRPPLFTLRRPTPAATATAGVVLLFAARKLPPTTTIRTPLLALTAACAAFLVFVSPIPQDPSYHSLADRRGLRCGRCLGGGGPALFLPPGVRGRGVVPNFCDVASNVVILLGGLAGLAALWWRRRARGGGDFSGGADKDEDEDSSWSWQDSTCLPVFFVATAAVSVGSTYYHWRPSNSTLVWDRLPMTVAFVSIFACMLDEYLPPLTSSLDEGSEVGDASVGIGPAALPPLLVAGVSSVVYWHLTDDLRPYALVQFVPLLTMPCLMAWGSPRHPVGFGHQVTGLILYAASKVCESLDREIFELTGRRLSGHTLKHVLAGMAPAAIAHMVLVRE